MSLHCERWTENLTGSYPIYSVTNGEDWDSLYANARCSSFDSTLYETRDADGDVIESGEGDGPTCSEHGYRSSEDEPDISYELERAGISVCTDCEEAYPDRDTYYEHRSDEHGENEDEDEGTAYQRQDENGNYVPIPPAPPRVTIRPHYVSTHSSWV